MRRDGAGLILFGDKVLQKPKIYRDVDVRFNTSGFDPRSPAPPATVVNVSSSAPAPAPPNAVLAGQRRPVHGPCQLALLWTVRARRRARRPRYARR